MDPDDPPSQPAGPSVQALGPGSVAVGRDNFAPINTTVFTGDWWRLQDAFLDPAVLLDRVHGGGFTGRQWLVAEFEEFLASAPSGYFLLEAEAGLGKTAFAAAIYCNGGHAGHFTRLDQRAREPAFAVRNLSAQLIMRWKLDHLLQDGMLPPMAGEPVWLARVLAEVAAARRDSGASPPVVMVVDGLDEAVGHPAGGMPLGLPRTLPEGFFVLATTQPGIEMPLPDGARVRRLTAESPENLADMAEHIAQLSDVSWLGEALAADGRSAARFGADVIDRCAGSWVYLDYVLQEIRLGQRRPSDVARLPQGLWSYYGETVQRWRRYADWRYRTLPVLATLAALAEPVTVATLAAFSGLVDIDDVRRLVGGRLRPYCTVEPASGGRFSLYHASLRTFLTQAGQGHGIAEDLDGELAAAVCAAHTHAADRPLTAWGGLEDGLPLLAADRALAGMDDGYCIRHVSFHLRSAARTDDVRALVMAERDGRPVWFDACADAGDTTSFHSALNHARELAERADDDSLAAGRPAAELGFEAWCHLVAGSIRSASAELTGTEIRMFATNGTWSLRDALSHVGGIRQDGDRADALKNLTPLLTPDLLPAALRVARGLAPSVSRVKALVTLARRLSAADGAQVVAEALAVTRGLDVPERCSAVAAVAPDLPDAQRRALLADALADAHREATGYKRARALVSLVPRLDDQSRPLAFAEIVRLLEAGTLPAINTSLLVRIVAQLDTGRREELLRAIGESEGILRAHDLTSVLPHLPRERWSALIDEALPAIRSDGKVGGLILLLPFVSGARRQELLTEAITIAMAAAPGRDRRNGLRWVLPHLAVEERARALREIEVAALQIHDVPAQYDALLALRAHCGSAEAAAIVETVLAGARNAPFPEVWDAWDRADVLSRVAPLLPARPRRRVVSEVVAALEQTDLRLTLLPRVAERIGPGGTVTRALVRLARRTDQSVLAPPREVALAALASHVPRRWSAWVWTWVWAAAASHPPAYRIAVLAQVAPFLPARRRPVWRRHIIAASREITDDDRLAQHLLDLAEELADELGDDKLQEFVPAVLLAIRTIRDPSLALRTWLRVQDNMPFANDPSALRGALDRARDRADGRLMRRLVRRLPESMLGEVVQAARDLEGTDLAGVLDALLPRLPVEHAPAVLDLAMTLPLHRGDLLVPCLVLLSDAALGAVVERAAAAEAWERADIWSAFFVAAAERLPGSAPTAVTPRRAVFAGLDRRMTLRVLTASAWWYRRHGGEACVAEITRAIARVGRWWP